MCNERIGPNGKPRPCGFCECQFQEFWAIGELIKLGNFDEVKRRYEASNSKKLFLCAKGFPFMNAHIHLACAVTDYGKGDRRWIDILRFLIESGANPNLVNFAGDTPLTLAFSNCPPRRLQETYDILIEAGATADAVGRFELSAAKIIKKRLDVAKAKNFDFGTLNDAGYKLLFGEGDIEGAMSHVKPVQNRLPLNEAIEIFDALDTEMQY